jgi:hypothetical protein
MKERGRNFGNLSTLATGIARNVLNRIRKAGREGESYEHKLSQSPVVKITDRIYGYDEALELFDAGVIGSEVLEQLCQPDANLLVERESGLFEVIKSTS